MVSKSDSVENLAEEPNANLPENHFLTLEYWCRSDESDLVQFTQGIPIGLQYFSAIGAFMYELMMKPNTTQAYREEGIISEVGRNYLLLADLNPEMTGQKIWLPRHFLAEKEQPIETAEDVAKELKVIATPERPFKVYDHMGGVLGVYKRGPGLQPRSQELRELQNLADVAQWLVHNSTIPQ
jgi:hypothetical protein